MPLYDQYTQYQTPLTPEEASHMGEAEATAARMDADETLEKVPGGYFNETEGFTPHPVIAEHMGIAMRRAEAQFRGWPAMPEDAETSIRFPGLDPVGHYSAIDMRFDQRMAQVKATLESRAPEVQTYVQGLINAAAMRGGDPHVIDTAVQMKEAAKRHRILTRASKLCLDPEGRRMLHEQSRSMETDLPVAQYDKYLQGIEYAAGVKTGPVPEDVTKFYAEQLARPLDLGIVAQARTVAQAPAELHVEFQDLDHKLLQQQFANPNNWGKKPPEADKEPFTMEEAAATIAPYARATSARTLDPLFSGMEDATGNIISRGDLIIVDGKTVREKMFEDYVATGRDPDEFHDFYGKNYHNAANDYVSAALMAGKRVEAFIPDKDGRIPKEPTQLTKTGYEPSPLKKVTLNAWERFFSKMGLYKEKTAKAAEYQRFVDARERVQTTNLAAQFDMDTGVSPSTKAQYFSGWMAEHGPLPISVPGHYSVTRSALSTFAVCALAARGHSIEEIHDPTGLAAEKQAVGREVMEHLQAGDQKWCGEVLFHGQRALLADVDRLTVGMDLSKESVVLNTANRALFQAATTLFDASQEDSRCRAEMQAAAERFAPGHGREVFDTLSNGVGSSVAYFDYARKSLAGRAELAGGLVPSNQFIGHLNNILSFQAAAQLYSEKISADPTLSMSKCFDLRSMAAFYNYAAGVNGSPAFSALTKRAADPTFRVALGKETISGRFQKRMDIKADLTHIDQRDARFGLRELSKEEAKETERADKLQKTDEKNAAKAAKKPQGPAPKMR